MDTRAGAISDLVGLVAAMLGFGIGIEVASGSVQIFVTTVSYRVVTWPCRGQSGAEPEHAVFVDTTARVIVSVIVLV